MDRCPHCATPRPTRPVCGVCGLPLSAPPAVTQPIPGLESGRAAPVGLVAVERVPGLSTTEEELGGVSIPIDEEPAPAVCRRCGAPSAGGRFCERCGFAVRPLSGAERAAGVVGPALRCLACGLENRAEALVCAGCGQRLHP